jgi:hypothetical protein
MLSHPHVCHQSAPRCIHSLVLTTTCGQQRLSGGTPNATAPTLTLSPPTNTAADKALKPARRFLAAFQGSPQPNQGPLGILRLVWGMSVPSTAPGVTKPSAGERAVIMAHHLTCELFCRGLLIGWS